MLNRDLKRKEEAEARNNAESLVYTAEKTKKDLAGKLGSEQVERIDKAVGELRNMLKGKDVGEIKTKSEDLAKVLQEVGAAVYQQEAQKRAEEKQHAKEAKPEEDKSKKSKDKVVDAKYKVVDEEKKD